MKGKSTFIGLKEICSINHDSPQLTKTQTQVRPPPRQPPSIKYQNQLEQETVVRKWFPASNKKSRAQMKLMPAPKQLNRRLHNTRLKNKNQTRPIVVLYPGNQANNDPC
jgi:hypothetical protein